VKHYNIVVIGCGGTGSWLIDPLIRFLNSLDRYTGDVILCDGDTYSPSNESRQSFGTSGIGVNKAEYHANRLSEQFQALSIGYVGEYLDAETVAELPDHTIYINCADNAAARKIVEDHVNRLSDSVHICCGNEMTRGQVQLSAKRNNARVKPSIYDKYPHFNSLDDDRSVMSCEDLAKLPSGGQVITANFTAACFALNYVAAMFNETDPGFLPQEVVYNTGTVTSTPIYDEN
jgi:molybdopterin/thiamine biosynthesis adenylyltransferase